MLTIFMGTSFDSFTYKIYEFDLEKKDLIELDKNFTCIMCDTIHRINYLINGNYF